jgi:hypothetical protein
MSIVTQAEQNQVVPINAFPPLSRQNVEMSFVLLRCGLRIEFAAHPRNRFFRNRCRHKQRVVGHSEVALWIIRWDAAFVAESDSNQLPWQIASDLREPRVHRPWSISTG